MPATNPFLGKFASSIIAILRCHDRIILKGHLPFADEAHLNRFVDHTLRIKRKDFLAFLEDKSELLVTHATGQRPRRATPTHGPRRAVAALIACAWVDRHDSTHASLPGDDQGRSGHECRPLRTLQSVSQRTTACSIGITENLRAARKSHRGRL